MAQYTVVNYHFMTYFGFLLDFFGGLEFADLLPLPLGSDFSILFFDCTTPFISSILVVISATFSFLDFERSTNSDGGSNLIGVSATI